MSCEQEHINGGHDDHSGHGNGHGHDHGHDGHSHSHVPPPNTNISLSLLPYINTPHITALNVSNPSEEVQKLFKPQQDKYNLTPIIKSDCDPQMIINIPFLNGSVKLFSLILRTNGDKYCPKKIKLYKNESIDFDSDKKPTFVIEHPQVGCNYNDGDEEVPEVLVNDNEFVEHSLPRHIFTGVQQLTLLIDDIYGDEDESHLHYIELRGEFTELSRDPVITIYEAAANPKDHKIDLQTDQQLA